MAGIASRHRPQEEKVAMQAITAANADRAARLAVMTEVG
jgi:hypothetical protein